MKITIYCTIRLLGLIVMFVFLFAPLGWAATYYVDATNGKDTNTGLSTATAWKTIAKVNASRFVPGDQILFKRGEMWRGMLFVPSSGASGNPITFGAYGAGSNPVITGADLITTGTSWTVDADNIWKASNITTEPKVVMMNGRVGNKQTSKTDCVAEYDWFWSTNTLYIYSVSDPDVAYTSPGVEIGQRLYCLSWKAKSYLTFQNIDFVAGNIYNIFMDGYTWTVIRPTYYSIPVASTRLISKGLATILLGMTRLISLYRIAWSPIMAVWGFFSTVTGPGSNSDVACTGAGRLVRIGSG